MDAWHRARHAATSGKVLGAFIVAVIFSAWLFSVGPYADMVPYGGILDERMGSGPTSLQEDIDALGPDGRSAYRVFLAADLVFPLLHAAWMAGFIAIGTKRWRSLPDLAIALPVVGMVFDWTENLAFFVLLSEHPDVSWGVAAVAAGAMHLKFAFDAAAAIGVLAVLAWMIAHPVQRRRTPSRRGRTEPTPPDNASLRPSRAKNGRR